MNTRRLFLIAGIILVVALAGFLAYYYLVYRPQVPENVVDLPLPEGQEVTLTPEEVQQGKTLEEKHEEIRRRLGITATDDGVVSVAKIIDRPVLSPTTSLDGTNLYFFDTQLGQFRISDAIGQGETALLTATFNQVQDVVWAPTKDAAILEYIQDGATRYAIVTIEDQGVVELDPRVESPTFSPDGLRIVYIFSDEDAGVAKVTTALRDGTNAKAIRSYRSGDVRLDWFAEERIAYGGMPSGFQSTSLYSMDIRGENQRTLLGDAYAADAVFSPDGSRVVFSEAPRKPHIASLLLMDATGANAIETAIDTLARKCAWSQTGFTLLCGVPSAPDESYIIPEDYEDRDWVTRDDLYRVNATTGEASRVVSHAQYSEGYDISDPFLSPDLDKLYFTRRNDNRVYAYFLP